MSLHDFTLPGWVTAVLTLALVYFVRRGEWQVTQVGDIDDEVVHTNLSKERAHRMATRLSETGVRHIAEPMMQRQLG